MEFTVLVNNNSSLTKTLIHMAKYIAKTEKSVKIYPTKDIEAMEDKILAEMIEEGMKTPNVSRDEIMEILNR